jgi:hypothetical protein
MKNAITKYDNLLIECISLLVIGISAVLTANYFGFPSSDPVVKAQAVIYALGVDGLFYLAVRLTRCYLAARHLGTGSFWLLVASGMGFFTYHNNLLFAANAWQLNQEALLRAGVSDTLELHLHALIPVIVVLIVSIIPRRQVQDLRTPEQILLEAEQKAALLQAKALLRGVESVGAGAGLRSAVIGVGNGLFKLDERKVQKEQKAAARAERRRLQEEKRVERAQIKVLAMQHHLITDEEQEQEDELESEEERDALYTLWQGRLQGVGQWPPAVAALPDVETLQAVAIQQVVEEVDSADQDAMTASGKHKVWMFAEDVAKELGISLDQAKARMKAGYRGRFLPIKSKEFPHKGRPVRKAHFQIVQKVKEVEQAKQQEREHLPVHLPMQSARKPGRPSRKQSIKQEAEQLA